MTSDPRGQRGGDVAPMIKGEEKRTKEQSKMPMCRLELHKQNGAEKRREFPEGWGAARQLRRPGEGVWYENALQVREPHTGHFGVHNGSPKMTIFWSQNGPNGTV